MIGPPNVRHSATNNATRRKIANRTSRPSQPQNRPAPPRKQDVREHAETADAGHLPAFLLRPVTAKA